MVPSSWQSPGPISLANDTAVPLGTGLGGPLVAAVGASHTLLISAATITTLGLSAGLYRAIRRTN